MHYSKKINKATRSQLMFLKLSNISSIVTKKKVKLHFSHGALYSSEVTKDQVKVILRLLLLNDPEGDANVIKSYEKFNCFAMDLFC